MISNSQTAILKMEETVGLNDFGTDISDDDVAVIVHLLSTDIEKGIYTINKKKFMRL